MYRNFEDCHSGRVLTDGTRVLRAFDSTPLSITVSHLILHLRVHQNNSIAIMTSSVSTIELITIFVIVLLIFVFAFSTFIATLPSHVFMPVMVALICFIFFGFGQLLRDSSMVGYSPL
ncbi:hypothetical protein BDV96DRAFT_566407 [Lophiotrema nucula]|uniref:Uncharacterized protein n=1 Tax=Lophiotrema nucula TaxID=690887 RepID=A0A6A5ZLC1_9PLEO|nr:hypothetical protein BDV96DRAFT_566407 [Lophiotrema nucula]